MVQYLRPLEDAYIAAEGPGATFTDAFAGVFVQGLRTTLLVPTGTHTLESPVGRAITSVEEALRVTRTRSEDLPAIEAVA